MSVSGGQVLEKAREYLGVPYQWGGDEPAEGFDCSGFTRYVYASLGIELPRRARQQQDAVTQVSTPQVGDLVFWGDPAHHVAIYAGSGQIIAAPHSGDRVKIQPIYGSPTFGRPNTGVLAKVGDALTAPVDAVGAAVSRGFQSAAGTLVDGAKPLIVKSAFALLAVGLIGAGVVRATGVRERVQGAAGAVL